MVPRAAGTTAPRARRAIGIALAAVLAGGAIADAATPRRAGGAARPPARLADTGLYSDFVARTVAAENLPFSPQYPLWSDGAGKSRWVHVPRGSSIDARDPDHWVFPVGTKLWKEFAWDRRVETRYLERTRQGWIYASYLWSEDGREALLAPEGGVVSTYEVAPGRRHRIPAIGDCKTCHRGGRSEVLGFGTLQLSPDRDPRAPNAEALPPGAVLLPELVRRGLLRGLPARLLAHPPRIAGRSPDERAALGYLHGNCGGCHDSVGPLAGIGLAFRHRVGVDRDVPEAGLAAVAGASRFQGAGATGTSSRWIEPGASARSTVVTRMASRSPLAQMPPLGTQLVDAQAVALLRRWIDHDLGTAGENARR